MTARRDPERWLSAGDEFAQQLRPVLPLLRGEGPSPNEHSRMRSALLARLPVAAEGGGGEATAATVSSGSARSGWGWVVGTGVVATMFGFALAMFTTRSTSAPRSSQARPTAAPARPSSPAGASPPEAVKAESAAPAGDDHERAQVAAPSQRQPHTGVRPTKPANPDSLRSLAVARPTPSAAESPVDVASELDLLARARRVVASEPARALQLTAEHGRRFADGVLAQEREVLAIDALSRLGHRDLAAARARRFIEHYPNSAHRVRLAAELEAP